MKMRIQDEGSQEHEQMAHFMAAILKALKALYCTTIILFKCILSCLVLYLYLCMYNSHTKVLISRVLYSGIL